MLAAAGGRIAAESIWQTGMISADIDLERIEHVTHPAMTKLLQRLESKGFIRGVPSQKDRRYKKVTCTQRSAGIHRLILAQDAEVVEELCSDFSGEEKERLMELVDLLLDRIGPENK